MEQVKYDVFISYSRKDYVDEHKNVIPGNEVSKIKDALNKAGITYWVDEEGIYSGEKFASVLMRAIRNSSIFLFISSVNSNSSKLTNNEISTALEFKKPIILFRLDNSPFHNSVSLGIECLYSIDFSKKSQSEIEELIRQINVYLAKEKKYEAEAGLLLHNKQNVKRKTSNPSILREVRVTIAEIKGCIRANHYQEAETILNALQLRLQDLGISDYYSQLEEVKEEITSKRREVNHLFFEKINYARPIEKTSNPSIQREVRVTIAEIKGCIRANHYQEAETILNALQLRLQDLGISDYYLQLEEVKEEITSKRREYNQLQLRDNGRIPQDISVEEKLQRFQFHKDDQELAIENEVYSSLFAPAEVKRKSHILVQVYLHLYEETEKVKSLAQESDKDAERRDYIPLQFKLKKGDLVDVLLNIYGETLLMSDMKSVVWQGSFTKCSFDYFVPKDIDVDELSCGALLSVNEVPIGEMRFITKIVEQPRQLKPEIIAHKYNKVFISYSHQDESKVKFLHEGLELGAVPHFFDRSYLKPGDVFPKKIQDYINSADLFILCWSENASKSEYVQKERLQALERAFPQVQPEKEAKLRIYPMSIEPRAELPSDMRDNYHFGEI